GTCFVPIATRRTVVMVKAPGAPVIASAGRIIIVATPEGALVSFTSERPLVALARKAALVEFFRKALFAAPIGGTPLSLEVAVAPAAGSVVFIVVAGHEGLVSDQA